MTLEEYLDPKRFPLTTQTHYEPKQQLMMDAFNYDELKEWQEDHELSERQAQLFAELSEKIKYNSQLTGELAAAAANEDKD